MVTQQIRQSRKSGNVLEMEVWKRRKAEAGQAMEVDIRAKGNLSKKEIKEYLDLCSGIDMTGIGQQLRYYYLRLKADDPEKAVKFTADLCLPVGLDYRGLNAAFVVILGETLCKYAKDFGGEFVLFFGGQKFRWCDQPVKSLVIEHL